MFVWMTPTYSHRLTIHILQSSTQSHTKSRPAAPSNVKAVQSVPFSDIEGDRLHV